MNLLFALSAAAASAAPVAFDCDVFSVRELDAAERPYSVSGGMNWPYTSTGFTEVSGSFEEGLRLVWTVLESTASIPTSEDLLVTLDLTDYDAAQGTARYALAGVAPDHRNRRHAPHIRRIAPFESEGECTVIAAEEQTS